LDASEVQGKWKAIKEIWLGTAEQECRQGGQKEFQNVVE